MPRGGGEGAAQPGASRWRTIWRRHGRGIQRVATALFLLLVAALLVRQAALVEWQEVGQALAAYSLRVLLLAGLCATLSLAVYSLYEPLTQIYLVSWLRSQGQSSRPLPQPWRRLQLVALISHVFNLNLGALIGGLGLRIRLYSRMGLGKAQVALLWSMSMVTNWAGYCLVAGGLFVLGAPELPGHWTVSQGMLRGLGLLLLGIALGGAVVVARQRGQSLHVRGRALLVPPPTMAALQWLLAVLHWSLMGSVLYLLLERQVAWSQVVGVLLLSAVAGAVVRVPASLGVLEAVFLTVLSGRVGRPELLAALLAYRALFYLLPLLAAALVYVALELTAPPVDQG